MRVIKKNESTVRVEFTGITAGWEKELLLLSDVHADSKYCDRKLLKMHLDEAMEKNAVILINGDLFDAMQGKNDPRKSYDEIKKDLVRDNYFDGLIDDVFTFFRPYAKNLAMVGYGNHEYSVKRFNGTDLVQRFIHEMRREGSPVVVGGYGGFIRISMYEKNQETPRDSLRIYYNHGSGGEAPVTKGVIQTARQAVWVNGCNAVWNGHNHQAYIVPQPIIRINNKDEVEQDLVYFLRTPGYKSENIDFGNGFAASHNMAPTPKGCIWAKLSNYRHTLRAQYYQDII